jgi:ubiquitin-protein ligase
MNKAKTIALKRISKDMKEITNNPIEGIGITQYENDFFQYIVNIKLMNGVYKDFCLQLLLTFSDSYPTKPPKILIFPGQNFNNSYHHHVFNGPNGFYKFCFDLLENDFLNTNEEKTGWNPSYTISSLLIQVQNFLCDPDLHHAIPESYITKFFASMKNYSKEFTDSEGKKVVHTWGNPYPPMYFHPEIKKEEKIEDKKEENEKNKDDEDTKDNEKGSNNNSQKKYETVKDVMDALNEIEKDREKGCKINKKRRLKLKKKLNELKQKEEEDAKRKKEEEEKKRLIEIKDNLTCFMLKLNYIEDPEILLGYPIIQKNTGKGLKIKIELYPIPELLTYDGFIAQIGKKDEKLDFYFDISFKSANNEFYNYWVPIYIDKNHFEKNKETILNSFSIIKFGAIGLKEYDFKTEYIFEILPIILNKMIIGIFNNKTNLSEAFIRCYFQYILLLKKLTEIYKADFDKYLNNIIENIEKNRNHIDKRMIPDIGNFLVLLLFSNFEISDKLWRCLIDESSIRQMYWMFHSEDTVNKVKNIIRESKSIDESRLVKSTEEKIEDLAKATKKGILKIDNIDDFKMTLKSSNIYSRIISKIVKDKNIYEFEEFKKEEKKDIFQQNPFAELDVDNVDSYNAEVLEKNFDEKINIYLAKLNKDTLIDIFTLIEDNIGYQELKKFYSDDKIKDIEKSEYDRGFADEILKDIEEDDIRKKLLVQFYENQKGNKLTLISFLARKKIKTPGFMEELEKNFGVLLNCSDFMKEIKTTIDSVKSYTDLYKFIDCDLIGKKTEYEHIIRKYQIAKKKRYIRAIMYENAPKSGENKNRIELNSDSDEYNGEGDDEKEGWEVVEKKKNKIDDNYYYNNSYNYYRGNNGYYRGRGGRRGRGRGVWRRDGYK